MRELIYVFIVICAALAFAPACGGEVGAPALDAGDADGCICVTCIYPTHEPCE